MSKKDKKEGGTSISSTSVDINQAWIYLQGSTIRLPAKYVARFKSLVGGKSWRISTQKIGITCLDADEFASIDQINMVITGAPPNEGRY